MISLSYTKAIVIWGIFLSMVRGCCYRKVIDFMYNNSYRYHENTIINKGFFPLVGIQTVLLLEIVPLIAGTM
jgi:hypothetical protein